MNDNKPIKTHNLYVIKSVSYKRVSDSVLSYLYCEGITNNPLGQEIQIWEEKKKMAYQ